MLTYGCVCLYIYTPVVGTSMAVATLAQALAGSGVEFPGEGPRSALHAQDYWKKKPENPYQLLRRPGQKPGE